MSMLERILVPVDLSPCSRAALAYAVFLGEHFGSEVVVLHVVDADEGGRSGGDSAQTGVPLAPACAKERLCALLAQFDTPVARRAQPRVVTGDPAARIIEAAREGFDLVVVGKYGWSGRTGAARVAARVSRSAPCGVVPVWEPESPGGPGKGFAFGATEPPMSSRSRWGAAV